MNKHIKQAQYKKGFANVILILVIIVIAAAAGYFALVKKSVEIASNQTPQIQDETKDKKPASSSNEATSQSPSITVISPNRGGAWEVGKSYEIKWSSSNLESSKDIILTAYSEFYSPPPGYFIARVKNISGAYTWTVPQDIKISDKYKIYIYQDIPSSCDEISGCHLIPKIFDESDAPFSIVQ